MNMGATNKELKDFLELLIKVNDVQLSAVFDAVVGEMQKRIESRYKLIKKDFDNEMRS